MLKRLICLIIVLSLQLGIFATPVFAAPKCKDSKIEWKPGIFLENAPDFTLTFTINDDNTLKTLKDNSVYLLVDKHILSGGSPTSAITLQENKFSWVLDGDQKTKGEHSGTLRWLPKGKSSYEDFCTDVNYTVGLPGRNCMFDPSLPSKIPPNEKITVKFLANSGKNYNLTWNTNTHLGTSPADTNGQGEFKDITIPGSNGDKGRLTIISLEAGASGSCHKDITIDSTATPPVPPPAGPIQPVERPKSTPCTDPATCVLGGGETCPDDGKGPAMRTALGCVHTNPAEFVKDFMTFIIAISGGFAFLMMLTGAFQMLASGGNPDSLQTGRDRFTSAIVGLLFVIFAVLLLQIIGVDVLKLPGFEK